MDSIFRVIDANLNRSQEGMRVCEDIARFVLCDKKITRSFKSLRLGMGVLRQKIARANPSLLKSRNVRADGGKKTLLREKKRLNITDVFRANAQRVKESLRVLEEVTKLINKKISQDFKKIRFRTYELEKKSGVKLESLLLNR